MDRKIKIGSISAGMALVAFPLGGWLPAALAAGAGYLIGDKQFPKGEKPWRDLTELLNEKEHGRLEFKSSLCEDSKRKSPFDGIIKSVVGFANSDGGEILLGVSDQAEILGVKDIVREYGGRDKFELSLRNALRSNIDSSIEKICRIKYESINEHTILRIEVEKSNFQVFTKQRGDFFVRDGNRTVALSAKEFAHRNRDDS